MAEMKDVKIGDSPSHFIKMEDLAEEETHIKTEQIAPAIEEVYIKTEVIDFDEDSTIDKSICSDWDPDDSQMKNYRTGGGLSLSKMNPLSEQIIGHSQPQFESLPNPFDSSSALFEKHDAMTPEGGLEENKEWMEDVPLTERTLPSTFLKKKRKRRLEDRIERAEFSAIEHSKKKQILEIEEQIASKKIQTLEIEEQAAQVQPEDDDDDDNESKPGFNYSSQIRDSNTHNISIKESLKAQTDNEITYNNEKPYTCDTCNYRSAKSSSLRTHKRTHTNEKPYGCTICDFRCTTSSSLIRHKRIHTKEKPYSCSMCDYKCSEPSTLTHHKRTHTKEKPYSCNICDYKCATSSTLIQHSRIHSNEKPYGCNTCDYKCNHRSSLIRHRRTHAQQ